VLISVPLSPKDCHKNVYSALHCVGVLMVCIYFACRVETVNDEVVDVVWTGSDGELAGCGVGPTLESIPDSRTRL